MSELEAHLRRLRRELRALQADVAHREADLGGREGRRLREQVRRVDAELAVLLPQCEALEASLFSSGLGKPVPPKPTSEEPIGRWLLVGCGFGLIGLGSFTYALVYLVRHL